MGQWEYQLMLDIQLVIKFSQHFVSILICAYGSTTDPRQTNIRHDKPYKDKYWTRKTLDRQILDTKNPRHNTT